MTAFAVSALVLGFAAPAVSAPLGLSPGDEILFLDFDALRTVPGDGGSYIVATNLFSSEGRITSVETLGSGAIGQSNVEFNFNLNFVSESLSISANVITFNFLMKSPAMAGPDFTITEGGIDILFGNFITGVLLRGNIFPGNGALVVSPVGLLEIAGGDAGLVPALGGVGADVFLEIDTIFDFDANVLSLIADGQFWNSNFVASLSGRLTPISATPFVPEPSTALLVGGGLLGLVGIARRARR